MARGVLGGVSPPCTDTIYEGGLVAGSSLDVAPLQTSSLHWTLFMPWTRQQVISMPECAGCGHSHKALHYCYEVKCSECSCEACSGCGK